MPDVKLVDIPLRMTGPQHASIAAIAEVAGQPFEVTAGVLLAVGFLSMYPAFEAAAANAAKAKRARGNPSPRRKRK